MTVQSSLGAAGLRERDLLRERREGDGELELPALWSSASCGVLGGERLRERPLHRFNNTARHHYGEGRAAN